MTIDSSIAYVGLIVSVAGLSLILEKYRNWKIFSVLPPLVWIYLILMFLCTMGLFDSDICTKTYTSLKNNLLYSMIFIMLLRCDFRKLSGLGIRLLAIFFCCSFTLGVGFFLGFFIFRNSLGNNAWSAVAALFASWIGGSANMAAMSNAFPIDEGSYSCAIALDTVCYSVWIAFLLYLVKYKDKWDRLCKAAESTSPAVPGKCETSSLTKKAEDSAADIVFLLGVSFLASFLSQYAGTLINSILSSLGITIFDKGTCSTLFATILGLVCSFTPLTKLPGIEKMSSVYLYVIVALLASRASLLSLVSAPAWVMYGFFVLLIHAGLMFLFSMLFHWNLCFVSIASIANIGGSAAAPVIASAYDESFVGAGVLLGILGSATGNFFGVAMGYLLKMI